MSFIKNCKLYPVVLIIALILIQVFYLRRINYRLSTVDNKIDSAFSKIDSAFSKIDSVRQEVLSADLAKVTEEIVKGKDVEQEKVIAIARWVSANISNRDDLGEDTYGWYAYRSGLCGARALLFVEMLKYLHIPARGFNIYNFGRPGGGHSCAQAYYNDKWHFFDVTYAGVFMKDGNVLSWEQIIADPEDAIRNLLVFKDSFDRYGTSAQDPVERKKVDNYARMHYVYSVENLANAKSYGFLGANVKTLYPVFDLEKMANKKFELGELDGNYVDVNKEGVNKELSERLGQSLGTATDTFHTHWEFVNTVPGKKYILKYYLYKSTHSGLIFWANSNQARIIKGAKFESTESLVKEKPAIWAIEVIADSNRCDLTIGYDFRESDRLVFADKIDFAEEQ